MRLKSIAQNTALVFCSLSLTFIAIEIGFRVLDPTPYFSDAEINHTEHGNLSMYDEVLGWKGVPEGEANFVTRNNRVWLAHNSNGFRDIEHQPAADRRPAVVFLGDSFTWGYEVEFNEMFVNLLRDRFPGFELYNLAHRGYGTDQSFLTFKAWTRDRPLQRVVLMFSENDVSDNNRSYNYEKSKPRFIIHQDELVLTGVPVPRDGAWERSSGESLLEDTDAENESIKTLVYRSHLINNMRIRFKLYRRALRKNESAHGAYNVAPDSHYQITRHLLRALEAEVRQRGARLVVAFIPSKSEIDELTDTPPFQENIAALCDELGIPHFDLAPALKNEFLRTYYRQGSHWNARGHRVTADALYEYLRPLLGSPDS